MTDAELLSRFCTQDDQSAFRELAGRHAGLVYHTAFRRTGDPELAREVSQTVFVLLARKAQRLRGGDGLAGWLHRAATLQAGNAARKESHRLRLMTALQQTAPSPPQPEPETLCSVWPFLDEALEHLPARDREVLLAHYFQGRTYQEIAGLRQESEAAVQRRASRALEKLSASLRRRGVAVPAVALTTGLSAILQQSAPAGILSVLPSTIPAAGTSMPWQGSPLAKVVVLLLAGGMAASLTFVAAQSLIPEPGVSGVRGPAPNLRPSQGPLQALRPLLIEPVAAADWQTLMAVAAEALRTQSDRHAAARAAWTLTPLKAGEYQAALDWAAALPPGDTARDALAGIVLCFWANHDLPAAWEASRSYVPGTDPFFEDLTKARSVIFLKRWNADPASCMASLPGSDDRRHGASSRAMLKMADSGPDVIRWRETVAATPQDDARAQGAILATTLWKDAGPEQGASYLDWVFALPFKDPAKRNPVLDNVVSMASAEESRGAALSGWLESLSPDTATTVLPEMQSALLRADEKVRLSLARSFTHPALLKALRESL